MAKKNSRSNKRASRLQVVAFNWNKDNKGEIMPWQYIHGKWVAQAGVPFGGILEICLYKDWIIIQNRSGNGDTGH